MKKKRKIHGHFAVHANDKKSFTKLFTQLDGVITSILEDNFEASGL
jgi:hypothetical protein